MGKIRKMKRVALALIALAFVVSVNGNFFASLNKKEMEILHMRDEPSARAKEICDNFASECKAALGNAEEKDQELMSKICKHIEDKINECYDSATIGESCYSECAEKTSKKVSGGKLWLASFLSCATCGPEYKKRPVQPKSVCNSMSAFCKLLLLKEGRPDAKKNLKGYCDNLKDPSVQTECVNDVAKNPVCFNICVSDCNLSSHHEDFKSEDWVACLENCSFCEEGIKDRRNRRRNLH
eukprot:TRINITY_DN19474_c0_g1_i1.p1 TRINITY_DN19474_c0_g1~~TRINITY_DN19474_c0_g1_i1.p1  ORF type:complete len:239 (+),score=56.67 TRINITY_DN19474_c0_g1_i1:101-817(+)